MLDNRQREPAPNKDTAASTAQNTAKALKVVNVPACNKEQSQETQALKERGPTRARKNTSRKAGGNNRGNRNKLKMKTITIVTQ